VSTIADPGAVADAGAGSAMADGAVAMATTAEPATNAVVMCCNPNRMLRLLFHYLIRSVFK
jgi:hypothetical protein